MSFLQILNNVIVFAKKYKLTKQRHPKKNCDFNKLRSVNINLYTVLFLSRKKYRLYTGTLIIGWVNNPFILHNNFIVGGCPVCQY